MRKYTGSDLLKEGLAVKGGFRWRPGFLSCALKGESESTREKLNGESEKRNTGQKMYGIFKEPKECQ